MEKKKSFVRTYFKEIGSGVLTLCCAFVVVMESFGVLSNIGLSLGGRSAVLLFSAVFLVNTSILCSGYTKTRALQRLRLHLLCATAFTYVFFIAVYFYATAVLDGEQVAYIAACGVFECLLIDWIVQGYYEKVLKEECPERYLFLAIRHGYMLSEAQQMLLLSTAQESWILLYIDNYYLCEKAEERLFSKPFGDMILEKYITLYNLNPKVQMLLLQLPDASVWVRRYIEAHGYLTADALTEVFQLPEAPQLIEMYLKQGVVLDDALELKLFDLSNGQELYTLYRQKYTPCDRAEQKAKKLGWI